ncbi:MBL fold metallo-hydrolase [Planctomycetota bacterium]
MAIELIETIAVGYFQSNCALVCCSASNKAVIIDPGGDADRIIDSVRRHGITVEYILHTHAHLDHIMGTRQVKEAIGAEICLHADDQYIYDNLPERARMFNFTSDEPLPVDRYLEAGQKVEFGECEFDIIHTPGHSPGGICFYTPHQGGMVFCGDTLFAGSIGRTDFWRGDYDQLIESIKTKILVLPPETLVIPGHGPNTTVAEEKMYNPFLQ